MILDFKKIIEFKIGISYKKEAVVKFNNNYFISTIEDNITIPNQSNFWQLIK